jgi:small-conductance mechanosensitive channel
MDILSVEFLGRPLSAYAYAAAIAAGAFLLGLLLLALIRKRTGEKGECDATQRYAVADRIIRRLAVPTIRICAAFAILAVLKVDEAIRGPAVKAIVGLATYFAVRLIISIIGLYVSHFAPKSDSDDPQKRIRPIFGFLRAVVWLAAALFYLDNLGVQVSSIVAGLGIGGIAVALAAQSILGDLFGYFIIYFDRPFEIGDFILFEDYTGTVEKVGIKTTKVRALTGEQIVVANSVLTNSRIRNYKRMERRRIVFTVGVTFETRRELLAAIPGMIRDAIALQPLAEFDRSHLKGLGPSSIDFENVYYVTTADYGRYMDTHQAVLLRLLECFAERGVKLAYPTTTVYVTGSGIAAHPELSVNPDPSG